MLGKGGHMPEEQDMRDELARLKMEEQERSMENLEEKSTDTYIGMDAFIGIETKCFLGKYICGNGLYFKPLSHHNKLASLVYRQLSKEEIELILTDSFNEVKTLFNDLEKEFKSKLRPTSLINEKGEPIAENGIEEIGRLKAFITILEFTKIKNRENSFIDEEFNLYLIEVKRMYEKIFERFRYLTTLESVMKNMSYEIQEKNETTFGIVEVAPFELNNPIIKRIKDALQSELGIPFTAPPYTPKVKFVTNETDNNPANYSDI